MALTEAGEDMDWYSRKTEYPIVEKVMSDITVIMMATARSEPFTVEVPIFNWSCRQLPDLINLTLNIIFTVIVGLKC